MPADAQRLSGRIGRRDRRAMAAVALTSLVAAAAAVVVREVPSHESGANCVRIDEAGVMGGGTWHLCGVAAERFCASRRNSRAVPPPACTVFLAQRTPPRRPAARAEAVVLTKAAP